MQAILHRGLTAKPSVSWNCVRQSPQVPSCESALGMFGILCYATSVLQCSRGLRSVTPLVKPAVSLVSQDEGDPARSAHMAGGR